MTTLPNILITGTPGVGKSLMCEKLKKELKYNWIDVSKLARAMNAASEFDDTYKTYVIDEDKVLDVMEPDMAKGGNIVDYHSCDFFPERWFKAVFVLRTDNTILYDRLVGRGYDGKKLEDNVQCEIFQTVLEEAKSSYKPKIVFELENNVMSDFSKNKKFIVDTVKNIEKKLSEKETENNAESEGDKETDDDNVENSSNESEDSDDEG